jgi:ribosomal-protein-alanine N-acetyltransferase
MRSSGGRPTVDDREALQTARLTLEPLRLDHAGELFGPLQDPGLYTYIPQEPPA